MNLQGIIQKGCFQRFFIEGMLAGLDHPLRHSINNPAALVAASGITPGMTMLEVGCGSGFFTPAAAEAVGSRGRLYAIDVVLAAVGVTAGKAEDLGLSNVRVSCADGHATGFDAGFFDLVLLYGVIPAPGFIDLDLLIPEMHRVLKSKGSLAVWTMAPFWSPRSIAKTGLFSYRGKVGRVHRFTGKG